MKKVLLVVVMTMASLMLTACNQIIDTYKDSKEGIEKIGLPIDDEANELPIISNEHPLQERSMLEKALEEQRHIHKLGFISEDVDHINTYTVYYPLDNTFGYSSMYRMGNQQQSIKFEAGTSFESTLYDSMVDSFVEAKEIKHDTLHAMYGEYMQSKTGDYYITAVDEDTTYVIQIGSEEEGYTDDLIKQIGAALRTEDDGAYDPFYEQVQFNLDKLKFPKVNDKRAAIHDVDVSVSGLDGESEINITYMLSERDTIVYHIMNKEVSLDAKYEEVDTFTLSDGTEVTEYGIDKNENHRFFHWIDRSYDYTMSITLDDTDMIQTDEIHDMIESAIKDDRSFENEAIFQPRHKDLKQTKADKNILDSLRTLDE